MQKNDKPWAIVAMHRPARPVEATSTKAEVWIKVFEELRSGKNVPAGEGTVYVVANTAGPKLNEFMRFIFKIINGCSPESSSASVR
ncbi:MAG: hypothetical protein E7L01_17100 [Paenibacillus macerans]|uniref:Uncharacterized protein n=1 Tax=Paenibacillus macerans TaxID=44252 RepID=A0A6N8F2B6_PAEMA|nr:hypothetical protein [Paenibacillus macerans]MCY7558255.1 hypothetical protein [Paenibacillus macerans]MDU7475026.1 hypothetical protein [Paenibacillus macerans]MEC0140875.1 hypothetical protein [Paenibacillus macerans]MEC0154607.1 hypothetical protein [Paenibacillus macerans]MUG26556.1 hypothetical protein [Paenibacillus macerans]